MYTFVTTSDGQTQLRGLMLKDIAEEFVTELKKATSADRPDFAEQLDAVFVTCQQLTGRAEKFSFMAFTIPQLTLRERNLLELIECETVIIDIKKGKVSIVCDDFGKINWFYVEGMSEIFDCFKKFDDCIGCQI